MPETPAVQLFITCLVDTIFPEAGEAVLDVLEGQGVRVEFPPGQTCCGQPAYNAGFRDEARAMAVHLLDVFEAGDARAAASSAPAASLRNAAACPDWPSGQSRGTSWEAALPSAAKVAALPAQRRGATLAPDDSKTPIVCPSGSCVAMLKHGYPDLFKDDPENLARARALADRTYEFTQYLVDELGVTGTGAHFSGTLAYHSSCHLLRGLGIDRQPRQLLAGVKEAEVVELPDATECCGFGGLFAIKHGDISGEILARKLETIRKSGAAVVVGCDVSCLMHIEGGLRRNGERAKCRHIAEILVNR